MVGGCYWGNGCCGVRLERCVVYRLEEGGFGIVNVVTVEVRMDAVKVF